MPPSALAVCKSLCVAAVLISICGSARGDVVFFERFAVKACKEAGDCDWRIRYKLGSQPQSWKYVCPNADCHRNSFEGDTGDTIILHHESIAFESYPVKLYMEVREYDREFAGYDWEYVGAPVITIDGPGSYWWWFENDEGHWEIYFDVGPGSTGTSQQPLTNGSDGKPRFEYVPAPKKYIGVFESGTDDHAFIANLDGTGRTWDQFVSSWEQKSAAGQRLVDIESYSTTDGRRYYGVYREGNDAHALLAGVYWSTLYDHWQDFEKQGLELIDSENYGPSLSTRFEAVFRAGSSPYNIAQGTWEDFTETWAERSAQGKRLVDIEIRYINGTRYYRGTFHDGSGPYALWVAPWASFQNKWQELTSAGLQLVDVETFREGGTTWYVGVYNGTVNGQVLLAGQTWTNFLTKYADYVKAGYRLIDIEVYSGSDAPADLLRAKKTRFAVADKPKVFRRLPSVPRTAPPREPPHVEEFVPNIPGTGFVRGDANADGVIEMADALVILGKLYGGDDKVHCDDAADTNDDGAVEMNDAVQILNFLFGGGKPPAGGPVGETQEDASPDRLGCAVTRELLPVPSERSIAPTETIEPEPVVLLRKAAQVNPQPLGRAPVLRPVAVPPLEAQPAPRLPRVSLLER